MGVKAEVLQGFIKSVTGLHPKAAQILQDIAPPPKRPSTPQPGKLKVSNEAQATEIATRQRAVTGSMKGANQFNIPNRGDVRVRSKDAKTGRVAVEDYATKGRSDATRTRKETPKTEGERLNLNKTKLQARQQSDDLIHQIAGDGQPSIAEHDVALRAGGSNEFMSISDPYFKRFKDEVEQKVYNMFGDKFIVDIDDVSGGVRIIPAATHNKFEPTSKQKGITIELGENIGQALKGLS